MMPAMRFSSVAGATIAAALLGSAGTAAADPVSDFYKGKTFTILVGLQSGTGFDIYARALSRHMGRHMPGNPTIVVQNKPGASGVNAANLLYNIGPKDGSIIGTFPQSFLTEPLYGNEKAKYDALKFNFIGNMEVGTGYCAISTDAGINTFEDLRNKEVVWGATGATGPLGKAAQAVNTLAGTKLKVIYGYKGSATVKLAIEKGEVKGICGLPYSTLKSFWKDQFDAKKMKIIVQLAGPKHDDWKDVPQLIDYMKTDEQKQLHQLIFKTYEISRVFVAPPDVPADRVAAIRKAFEATMKDKAFLADAEKTRIEISPTTADEVRALVAELYKTPPALVKKAFEATLKK